MKYYRDENGKVRAIAEGQDFLIQDEWVEMAADEVEAHINPPPTYEQKRQQLQRDRDTALNSITHEFSDGTVVQVRPQDIGNFQLAIERGTEQRWVTADNKTRMTTVAEMQEALAAGTSEGEQIWSDYADAIEALNSEYDK